MRKILSAISVLLLALLACNLPAEVPPTQVPPAPGIVTPVPQTEEPLLDLENPMFVQGTEKSGALDSIEGQDVPQGEAQYGNAQEGEQSEPQNALNSDCTVQTYIKNEAGTNYEPDSALVLAKWADGAFSLDIAQLCAALNAKGIPVVDVHEDAFVHNVSFILMEDKFSWEEIITLSVQLRIARIAAIHQHPSGTMCIDYDMASPNTATYGPVTYYQLYGDSDWDSRPEYHCPALSVNP